MFLVDTSVWIEHFRRGEARLAELLEDGQVVLHPFVHGELACGNLRNRRQVLDLLVHLPVVDSVSDPEALHLLESHRLMGRGIGWVDIHLLASCRLAGVGLWTLDRALGAAAARVGVG